MTELTATRITREADKHFCKLLSDAKAAADQSFLANLRQDYVELSAVPTDRLSDANLMNWYNKNVSRFQARKNKHGRELEEAVRTILARYNIPFKEQVLVCKTTGEILGKKGKKPTHRVDFVVGRDIAPGRNISEFIVISAKTTCRDRAYQDEWMNSAVKPKLFVLLTSGSDYPSKVQFDNSDSRMIVSTAPAVRNPKTYKAIRVSKMLQEIVQLLDERRERIEDNHLPAMALSPLQRQNAIHPHPFTQAPAPILSRPAPIPVPRTALAATATTASTASTATTAVSAATARGMILPKPVALAKSLTSTAAASATRHDELYFWEEDEYDDRLPSLPTV